MIQSCRNVGIIGIGAYVPEKTLTNADLEKMVDTSDEWIRTRTGIAERHIVNENVWTSDIGAEAARMALEDAGISPEQVDLIIVATATPDMFFPSTACVIQGKIGAKNAAAFDLSAACTGFVYALNTASQFLLTGYYKTVLVIGAETLSKVLDWEDRNTCILFGDGAGAVVLQEVQSGFGILSTKLGADGALGKCLTLPACARLEDETAKRREGKHNALWMNGQEVFKFAVKIMEFVTRQALEDFNLRTEDVNLIVPHQANTRIMDSAAERLNISRDKIYSNIHKYGNMSAASIPVALYEACKENKIVKGDIVVLVGFGGGLTWGSAVIRWNK